MLQHSVSSHALLLSGDVQVMPCDEVRGESPYYVVPTRETFRKHPGELLPWELVGTLVGQTKSLGVRISSTQVQGKFGIFCALDISKMISTGSLSPLQTVPQASFQDGGLLLFSVRHNRLVCFASGPQYGTRVWIKGLTENVTPYIHAHLHRVWPEPPRSTLTYEVAAAASLLGTMELFDAKQQSGSTHTFEFRYTNKQSAALATDFTAGDIIFTAAVPNALLCNQLITSISELLENDCSDEDNTLVSVLQVGSPVPSAPIPEHFNAVLQAVAALPLPDHLKRDSFSQVQVSLHTPDGAFSTHCDLEAYDVPVVIASTLSTTSMQIEKGCSTFDFLLEPGSLLVLTRDSGTKFSHGIETRQHEDTPAGAQPRGDRLNLTLRNVRKPAPSRP